MYDAVVAGVFRSPVPAIHRPWLSFGFVATWLAVVRSGSGARMVARKKTKSGPKAKAAAKTKSKAKTKSSAGTIKRKAKSPSQSKARSKPATKIKPKTTTMPRSKRPAKDKPKTPATTPPKPAVSVPGPVTPAPSNPQTRAPSGFQVEGSNDKAPFTLKLHRGDGMTIIAMNWKNGQPPQDFVGFAIEYHEPGGNQYYALNNRLGFLDVAGNVDPTALSTLKSPIQKFRWVHFPRNADLVGDFKYRVTPMFMDAQDKLSTGEPQEVAIQLARETYHRQRHLHARFRLVAGLRRPLCQGRPDQHAGGTGRRQGSRLHLDPPRQHGRACLDGLRGARRDPPDARPSNRRQGRGPRCRLRLQSARSRRPSGEARQLPQDHHRRQQGTRRRRAPPRPKPRAASWPRLGGRTCCASTWAACSTTRPSR